MRHATGFMNSRASKRMETLRAVWDEYYGLIFLVLMILMISIGCFIAAVANSSDSLPFGVFFLALAGVFMIPILFDLKTRR
jgi:hypothetical protein